MKPLRLIIIIVFTCFIVLSGIAALNLIVDPFGIWNSKVFLGFNNYKYGQEKYNRLFKAYELYEVSPDVVFLGSSIVQQGFPTQWSEGSTAYNSAFAGGTLNEAEKMLDYILRLAKKPKKIIIGVAGIGASGTGDLKGDFSEERLNFISRSRYHYMIYKIRETLLSSSAVDASIKSVLASVVCPDLVLFEKGWKQNNHFGRIIRSDFSVWRYYLQVSYEKNYYQPTTREESLIEKDLDTIDLYRKVKEKCDSYGVEVIFVVMPKNLEETMLVELAGNWKREEDFKRKLVEIAPVWDYSILTDKVIDRHNWIDTTHFRGTIGEDILKSMSGTSTLNSGILLKKENVDYSLSKIKDTYGTYKNSNMGLFLSLKNGSYFKLSDVELKNYIQLSDRPMYIEDKINVRIRSPLVQAALKTIID